MPDLREVLAALGSLKAYFWGLIDEKTFQKQTNMNLFYLLLMESEFEPLRKKEVGLEVKSGVELKWNAQSVLWVCIEARKLIDMAWRLRTRPLIGQHSTDWKHSYATSLWYNSSHTIIDLQPVTSTHITTGTCD